MLPDFSIWRINLFILVTKWAIIDNETRTKYLILSSRYKMERCAQQSDKHCNGTLYVLLLVNHTRHHSPVKMQVCINKTSPNPVHLIW